MSGKNESDASVIWKLLLGVILVMAFFWWRSEEAKLKRIEELKTQVEIYEEEIRELKNELHELYYGED